MTPRAPERPHRDPNDAGRPDEERLRALARQLAEAQSLAHIGSWEWDVVSNRVTWSDEMYRIYGLPTGTPIDFETFLAGVHPEERVQVQESVGAALAAGRSFEFQHRVVRPDGEVRRIQARGATVLDEQGRPIGMRGTGQDITRQYETERQAQRLVAERAAREAAEEAERRMEFLARASAELASSLDYETTLRTVARLSVPEIADWCAVDLVDESGLRRLSVEHTDPSKVEFVRTIQERYPPDPAAPQGPYQVVRTGRAEMFEEIPDSLLEASAVDEEHLRMLRSLGLRSYICAPVSARGITFGALTVVHAESGRRYGTEMLRLVEDLGRRAGIAIDNARLVRELEQARVQMEEQASELETQAEELQTQNEELEQQSQELAAALRARGDFMATVSHELRTPLNAIMGYTQLIEMGISGDIGEPALGHIRRIGLSARHLLQLIDDILTFSALEANRETAEIATVRLADVLSEVAAIIEPIAERAALRFSIDAQQAPELIDTDARKLRQILLNLLGNAVKFTSQGSVELVVRPAGPDLLFDVRDTGMGIPIEEQQRMFEPYWQSDQTRTRQIGGAGLGLTISHRFARVLGGELTATSIPGAGSTFTLRLPLAARRR